MLFCIIQRFPRTAADSLDKTESDTRGFDHDAVSQWDRAFVIEQRFYTRLKWIDDLIENIFIENPKVTVRDDKDTPDFGVTTFQVVKNQCTGFIKVSLTSVEKTGDTAFYRLYYCLLDYRFIDFIAISVADEYRRFIFLDHFYTIKKARIECVPKNTLLDCGEQLSTITENAILELVFLPIVNPQTQQWHLIQLFADFIVSYGVKICNKQR